MTTEQSVWTSIAQYSQEYTWKPATLWKRDSSNTYIFLEYFEISENSFFYRTALLAASKDYIYVNQRFAVDSFIYWW